MIDNILTGEQAKYAALVDKYKSYAFTIAFKIVGNREEAEEVAQDAFVKAYQYLKNFNRQAKFSTWLYRIVFNTAISYKRKHRAMTEEIENVEFENSDTSEAILERNDKEVFISRAMEKLNETDQIALRLFYLNELNLDEVATMMNQNVNTIKVRIHRARLRLAEELKRLLPNEALSL